MMQWSVIKILLQHDVLVRTMGIDTHHIGTFTKELKVEDKDFVVQVSTTW